MELFQYKFCSLSDGDGDVGGGGVVKSDVGMSL